MVNLSVVERDRPRYYVGHEKLRLCSSPYGDEEGEPGSAADGGDKLGGEVEPNQFVQEVYSHYEGGNGRQGDYVLVEMLSAPGTRGSLQKLDMKKKKGWLKDTMPQEDWKQDGEIVGGEELWRRRPRLGRRPLGRLGREGRHGVQDVDE